MTSDEKFASKEPNGVDSVDRGGVVGSGGVFKTDEESEPCLEEKSKGRVFWNRTQQQLLEKSGLTAKGLYYVGGVLIAALVLFIVVVALAACWPATPHHHRFPVCKSDACLRAATQIQQYMNESVSPCEDVREWACGGWLNGSALPPERSKWNRRAAIELQEAVRVRELISTLQLPLLRGTVEWKLKYFYESCIDMDAVDAYSDRPLKNIISELGGWNVLRDWTQSDFDFNNLLRSLHVNYGVSPYFKITTIPSSRQVGTSSIVILPAGLGLPDRSYYYMENTKFEKAYEQLITDVILTLSDLRSDSERFGRDIFSYEKRLAEIMPDSSELLDPIAADNPVKVSALQLTAQQILPLQDILTAMYPNADINEDTEVIVAHPDYMAKLSHLVSSTDDAMKNSYMIWTLVREYIPYLSSDYQKAVHQYHSQIYGIKEQPKRWEFCANLVQRFMPLAIDTLTEAQNPIADVKPAVREIFESVTVAATEHLEIYKSNNDLYSKLVKKLNSLYIKIGLPRDVFNSTYAKTYYYKLNIQKSNLFENCKKAIAFKKKLEEQRIHEPNADDYIIITGTERRVTYVPSNNAVVVPRAVLISPHFEPGYAQSINYGRLGQEIALAVVSSVLPYDSAWTADGKLLSRFHLAVNESLRLVRFPTTCLANQMSRKHYVPSEFSNATALNAFKYLSALNIASDALQKSLKKEKHIHLPTLETYEDLTLFHLVHIQELCTLSTDQQNLYDTLVDYKLPANYMLQMIQHQSYGLWDALQCGNADLQPCSDIF